MIRHTKNETFESVVLSKSDIHQLAGLILKEFSPSEEKNIEFSASKGISTIKEDNLNSLLDQLDINEDIKDFSIQASLYGNDRKYLTLSFRKSSASLYVSGMNENWVIGFTERIKDFLKARRSFVGFLNTPIGYSIAGVLFILQMWAVSNIALSIVSKRDVNGYVLSFLIFSLILWHLDSRMKYIHLTQREKASFKEKYETPLFVVFGVATIIQMVLAAIDMIKN